MTTKVIVLMVLIVTLAGWIFMRITSHSRNLRTLSGLVQQDIVLDGMTDLEKAVTIRDHLYWSTAHGQSPPNYDFYDFPGAYLDATINDVSHICGGMTLLYMSALESQGIPARYVGIWSDGIDNHTSVEFWDGERWIASDPTFNVIFRDRGYWLSWAEVWQVVQAGGLPEFVGNQRPERDIRTYYIPFNDLVRHIVIHPAMVSGQYWPMELYPADWSEGASLQPYEGVYEVLGRGLLR